ncbi:transcription elongation factor GreA [Mycoplasma iguanae]|uniref:Transcription elongation factor GreA n=1 Tax=Mycoplasma iguanae TaxID=292461 RepID=A0ABY5R9H7_9MOLU|nr:transcription elongation factor GreA [Mycoplasma iguanae]UVD81635.1 transcription elongation factor GreA [Mycoplasma iguanae]
MIQTKKDQFFLTQESLDAYKAELENLITVERTKVIEEIKEARSQGDLSENAEYDAAREKQGIIESRIAEIEYILSRAQILKSSNAKTVSLGSKVKVLNLNTQEELSFQIVGSLNADPFEAKISNLSPLAQAILGHKKDDEVEVDAPEKYTAKILEVSK